MKKLLTISIVFLLLVSCFKPHHKENMALGKETTAAPIITKPPSSFQEILIVSETCALFYQPDSVQKEKIRAVTEARVFEASIHGFFYQQKYAHKFLKEHWSGLKVIEAKNVRFIAFIRKDGSSDIIDLDKLGDSYGLLVFNRIKPPFQIDMTNTETLVSNYFKKY